MEIFTLKDQPLTYQIRISKYRLTTESLSKKKYLVNMIRQPISILMSMLKHLRFLYLMAIFTLKDRSLLYEIIRLTAPPLHRQNQMVKVFYQLKMVKRRRK